MVIGARLDMQKSRVDHTTISELWAMQNVVGSVEVVVAKAMEDAHSAHRLAEGSQTGNNVHLCLDVWSISHNPN